MPHHRIQSGGRRECPQVDISRHNSNSRTTPKDQIYPQSNRIKNMIKLSEEKKLADLDAQIAEAEAAGGEREQLAALEGKLQPLKCRLEELSRDLETEICRMRAIETAVADSDLNIQRLRFDPARIEALNVTNGSGRGALQIILNFDKAIAALRWWKKNAPAKIAEKKRVISKIKARCSQLEREIAQDDAQLSTLRAAVALHDRQIRIGHEFTTVDSDSPSLIRRRFHEQSQSNRL